MIFFIFRLRRELRNTIESQLNSIEQSDGFSFTAKHHIEHLQNQLKAADDVSKHLLLIYCYILHFSNILQMIA